MSSFVFAKNHLLLCHLVVGEFSNVKEDVVRRLEGVKLTPVQRNAIIDYLDLLETPSKDWQTKDSWLIATITAYFVAMMNEHYGAFVKCLDDLDWRMEHEWMGGECSEEEFLNIRRSNHETRIMADELKKHGEYKLIIHPDSDHVIISTDV